jgi:hypothetical protein
MDLTNHTGSCHCGAVRFEVDLDLTQPVVECNCSHCSRKGFLLSFVGAGQFKLTTPDAPLTEYRFNRHAIAHLFCPTCGVEAFARGETPTGAPMVAVNVRCIDGVDLSAQARQPFDGKSL